MVVEKKSVDLRVEPLPQIDRTPPVQEEVLQAEPSTEVPVETAPVMPENPVVEQPPVIPVQPVADVDEFGVPWKNRALEWKRKSEEVIDRLPQMIDEKLSRITQPQQPTYTYEQLEAYKLQNSSDSNIVAWATGEQRKMQQVENKKLFEEVVGSREQVNKADQMRQASLNYVKNTYPEAFDNTGNWNFNNPIAQNIRNLMQNPKLSNDPEGLAFAADAAYGRVQKTQIPILHQKVQQGKADVKQAQKASLTEGSGRRVVPNVAPQQTAIDNLRKTGSTQDAQQAIGAILRQKGILVD